jgi:cytochrome P450
MQMILTVAAVVQKFRWILAPEQGPVQPEAHVAVRPQGGMRMVATARGKV